MHLLFMPILEQKRKKGTVISPDITHLLVAELQLICSRCTFSMQQSLKDTLLLLLVLIGYESRIFDAMRRNEFGTPSYLWKLNFLCKLSTFQKQRALICLKKTVKNKHCFYSKL
jgi:hypothetical protein